MNIIIYERQRFTKLKTINNIAFAIYSVSPLKPEKF